MNEMIKVGENFPIKNDGATFTWNDYRSRRHGVKRPSINLSRRAKSVIASAVAFAIIISGACGITKAVTTKKLRAEFEVELKSAVFKTEQELAARMRDEYGLTAQEELAVKIDEEAKIMAKAAYFANNNTDEGVFSVCAAIANRVMDRRYPDTVYGVCSQAGNIQGWSEDNPVVKRLYDISKIVVTAMHEGVHLIDPGYVYINWSSREVILLDSIEANGRVHKFYESDWGDIVEQYISKQS